MTHSPVRRQLVRIVACMAFTAGLVVVAAGDARAAQTELDSARSHAADLAREFQSSELETERLEAQIASVQAQVEATKVEFDAAAATMSEAAVDRYVQAGQDLDLFAREEVDRQAQVAALSRLLSQRRSDDADRFRALREDLEVRQAQLDGLLADQRKASVELDANRQSLYEQITALEELERQRVETARLQQEELARQQAAASASALAAAAVTTTAPAASGGGGRTSDDAEAEETSERQSPTVITGAGGTCPVAGGVAFSDTWGDSRSAGRSHAGVDMFANYGVPLVAVESGYAEENSGGAGGIGVYLNGASGQSYYYAHLEDLGTLGNVSEGTVIGYVGDTGNASGTPHLHFETHPGGWGTAVNPYGYVASRC